MLASFLDALDLDDVTLIGERHRWSDLAGARRPLARAVGRLVLTSCDAFENYPPKAVAYLKPTARYRRRSGC